MIQSRKLDLEFYKERVEFYETTQQWTKKFRERRIEDLQSKWNFLIFMDELSRAGYVKQ